VKYARNKPIGDFLVTVKPLDKNGKVQLSIEHAGLAQFLQSLDTAEKELFYQDNSIKFDIDLFWLDESSYKPDGEAHLQTSFKGVIPFTTEVKLRSKENHLRINSDTAKGGIEAITWRQ